MLEQKFYLWELQVPIRKSSLTMFLKTRYHCHFIEHYKGQRHKHYRHRLNNSTTLQADLTLECQQEDSVDNIDTQITEQVSSQISSLYETNRNQQIEERFDNFHGQIVAVKAYFMNKIYELKN